MIGIGQNVQLSATEVCLMQALLAAGRIGAEVSLTTETSSAATGPKGRVESLPNTDHIEARPPRVMRSFAEHRLKVILQL